MAEDDRRVVVTGLGVVSGFGVGCDRFADALFAGRSALRPITAFDASAMRCRRGAEVPGFDGTELVPRAERFSYDRVGLLAMAAADEALAQAGLEPSAIGPVTGAMIGSAFGPARAIQEAVLQAAAEQRLRPTTIVRMMLNGPTAALCARYALRRASEAHVTACAASAHAIAAGMRAVRRGEMEVCLAGGAEAFPGSALYAAWDALGVMAAGDAAIRPFSPGRRGFAIGEGAAVLVLERRDRAMARGAAVLAELRGAGAASDAPSLTRPTLRGMVAAMRAAIIDAGFEEGAGGRTVDYVNAHGTATALNDAAEAEAIATLPGAVAVSACKAAIGHCMGAGGALEAAATILALGRQQVPCPIDLDAASAAADRGDRNDGEAAGGPAAARPMRAERALSNSFAFGGHYAVLALGAAS